MLFLSLSTNLVYYLSYRCLRKHRQYCGTSWQERIANRRKAWQGQMPLLLQAYMEYKYDNQDRNPMEPEHPGTVFRIAVLGTDGQSSILCALLAYRELEIRL